MQETLDQIWHFMRRQASNRHRSLLDALQHVNGAGGQTVCTHFGTPSGKIAASVIVRSSEGPFERCRTKALMAARWITDPFHSSLHQVTAQPLAALAAEQ